MMFKILVIFLITFTPINTTPCDGNQTCQISSTNSDEKNIICDFDNSTGYTVNIKSKNNIEIVCKNWRTWENFYVKGRLSEKILQSLSFEQCGLPNGVSLKAIARQLGNLKQIMLVSSGIERIYVGTFKRLVNLESLNIMSNYLEKIKEGTFEQLVSLTCLNLANNFLSNLPPTIFHWLKNLKMLDMSRNNFSSLPANLFDQNKELRGLYLHNNRNKMSTLPDNLLANLTKLTEVHLNNNGFLFLPENLFWGSSSLQNISLNDNSLVTLPENFFRGLNQVRKLSIKNNEIKTLPDQIFEDMEELVILDLSNNLMTRVSSNLFTGMVSLYELNMERNQLLFIDEDGLASLINLCIARFSHNPLTLTYVNGRLSVFYTNQYLEELYLSNSSIYNFFDDWSSGNHNLRLLDLSHNFISNITFEEKVELCKENHEIVIHLEHNPLLCDCPLYDLLRYRERKMSNLVYNYYNFIIGNLTCVQPDGTNEIEISNLNSSTYECLEHEYFKTENKCQNNCTCNIRPADNTLILDCSYKNISEFLIDETRVIFQRDNPIILNLTGNFLTEIPSTEPLYPINVTGLLLSNNKISSVTLDKLPYSLKILELHNNHISRISDDELNYLKSKYWEKFTLSGNPIICDCNNGGLIKFVKLNRAYYKDLDNLTCEDTHLPIYQIKASDICPLHQGYWEHILVGVPTSLLVVAIIVVYFNINNIRSYCSRWLRGGY
ncbi:protein toll-like [Polistes fuscatus]|uniref:protein toll-like n=1 Tax=Polistes fuscatus TaxID=30207 RepID=UPI001CA86684|nr:protein toll-like [Polistes fuscatus]